ncbi:hypothetical protein ACVWYH_004856 [Bradyrhizobium sp. GM24.11]
MIAAARWRKRLRESSASLFILVQIQAGSPRFAPAGLRVTQPRKARRGEACPAKLERSESEDGLPPPEISIRLNHITLGDKPEPVGVLCR